MVPHPLYDVRLRLDALRLDALPPAACLPDPVGFQLTNSLCKQGYDVKYNYKEGFLYIYTYIL